MDSRIATIAYNVNKKSPKVCVFAEVKDVYFPTVNQRGGTPMLYYRSMIEDFYACKYGGDDDDDGDDDEDNDGDGDDGNDDDSDNDGDGNDDGVMMVRIMWRITIVMTMMNDDIDDIARYE